MLPIVPTAPERPGKTELTVEPIAEPILPNPVERAPPTPGINKGKATGATFFTTFFSDLPSFLKKPNCSKPVCGFSAAMPLPTTAASGLIPNSRNLLCTALSKLSSSKASGGNTTSPVRKCAN